MKGVSAVLGPLAVSKMISPSFKKRVISGLILGPVTLATIIYGGLPFKLFVAIAYGLAVREWMNMALLGKHVLRDGVLGFAYLTLCFLSFWKLRIDLDQGLFLTFCLLVTVWSSDVAAYFSGKFIGGPKLAPAISPNKTWAGLIGGCLGSAIALTALNFYATPLGNIAGLAWVSFTTWQVAMLIGLFFTVFGQIGDLLVSSYKRKVGVKDTGAIIPGHGGILDRIDSLLLVTLFFLVVVMEISS